MPFKTSKPCAHPGCTNLVAIGQYCENHKQIKVDRDRARYRRYNDHRDPASQKMYNSRKWQKRRAAQLEEFPYCHDCLKDGRHKPAEIVHHVVPHKGNQEIFDKTPLMSLCKSCHDRRTGIEMHTPYNYPDRTIRSVIPIVMVCGAPASGKTSYVNQNKKEGDIVFDLDVIIADATGKDMYSTRTEEDIDLGLRLRNLRLYLLERMPYRGQTAWFIVSAASVQERDKWREILRPRQTIVLLADVPTCSGRIRSDRRRDGVATNQLNAVVEWWKRYASSPADTIIDNR